MLRPATDDDVLSIRDWRNHDKVRKSSQITHFIPLEEHLRWWASVRENPAKQVLIYEHDGKPAGVVTFTELGTDPDTGEYTTSWGFFLDTETVEPSPDALRIWVQIEKEAIDYAFDTLGVVMMYGETLAWNEAVRQLHRRFGMTEPSSVMKDIDGVPTEVVRNELRVENRRGAKKPR
jgi:RimJ/RimL family protein N-acetyltransferase